MTTARQAAAVALIAWVSWIACGLSDTAAGQGQPGGESACSTDDVLETLHDAVFFLEHRRELARVAKDLAYIQAQVTGKSPGAAMVLPLTQRIAELAARDGVLEPDSETIRAELHASPCMTHEAHERFHRALPPLP